MIRIETTTRIRAPIERCFDLARSVEVHLLENIHCGEQARAVNGVTSGLVGLGQRVTWRAKHFGVWHTLTSEIAAIERPRFYENVMVSGPFRSMRHDYWFREESADVTVMTDAYCFAAPIPLLGRVAEILLLRRYMRRLVEERNRVIREVAESEEWRRYLS
jgi:ligand-binding SRPBCC domain-containing protein